jgi:hypothetical protein
VVVWRNNQLHAASLHCIAYFRSRIQEFKNCVARMEPPLDDDDLINDYVDDYEPPVEYDDDFLEEMMGEASPAATAATSTQATTIPAALPAPTTTPDATAATPTQATTIPAALPAPTTTTTQAEPMEEITEEPTNVRDYISRQNDDSHLYNFKRYDLISFWLGGNDAP